MQDETQKLTSFGSSERLEVKGLKIVLLQIMRCSLLNLRANFLGDAKKELFKA